MNRITDGKVNIFLAVSAGVFATAGSFLGKLAGGAVITTVKFLLFILMIVSNTAGCMMFVKALHGSGSSLPATIISSVTNYVCSALVGIYLYDEILTLKWWVGATFVLFGFVLIYSSSNDYDKAKSKHQ